MESPVLHLESTVPITSNKMAIVFKSAGCAYFTYYIISLRAPLSFLRYFLRTTSCDRHCYDKKEVSRTNTRVKRSLPVLLNRPSASASVKNSRGYCSPRRRRRLHLTNSRSRIVVKSSGPTRLSVAAVSIRAHGASRSTPGRTRQNPSIRKTWQISSPASWILSLTFIRYCPGTQCLFCLGDVSLAPNIRTRCFANPFTLTRRAGTCTSNISRTFLKTSASSVPILRAR
jgi:hypothetical protein